MLGDHALFNKSLPFEAFVPVPLLLAGPGIPSGSVSDALVELSDINATICEFAGLPPQERIDAESFAGVVRGASASHRTEAVISLSGFELIRTRTHKYVYHVNGGEEVYDLSVDPEERRSLADEEAETAHDLSSRLRAARQLV